MNDAVAENLGKKFEDLSPDQVKELVGALDPAQYEVLLGEIEDYQAAVTREKAQSNFMEYVKQMWLWKK